MEKMTRRTAWILILCFSTALPISSALPARAMGSKGGEQPPPASERAMEGKITIQRILGNPAEYVNKEIVLEGAFQGWKGKCEESSPLTRSDWILKDETGCIYVSGKIPAGVSTLDPKGEPLVVSGVMKIKEGGKPFFQAKEVTRK